MSICPDKSNASHFGDQEIAISGYLSLLMFCSFSTLMPVLPAKGECPNTYPPHEQVCQWLTKRLVQNVYTLPEHVNLQFELQPFGIVYYTEAQ